MKKSDLKIGYVVKLRDGSVGMIMPNARGDMVIPIVKHSGKKNYCELRNFRDDLTNEYSSTCDITEVYNHCTLSAYSADISTDCRDLLWKRSEPKKMTVKEICDALGYDVEVVKDGDSK